MSRPETLERWKKIIDEYQRDRETLKAYCERLGVNTRLYHKYRNEIYGRSERFRFKSDILLPVIITNSQESKLTVNDIRIAYTGDSISDAELQRILRLCRDL